MKKYVIAMTMMISIGCASNTANSNTIELQGGIYVKGTGEHTYLVIEDSRTNKDYKIKNPNSFDLNNKQSNRVKLKAKLIKKAKGPGFPAEIEVIEIKN